MHWIERPEFYNICLCGELDRKARVLPLPRRFWIIWWKGTMFLGFMSTPYVVNVLIDLFRRCAYCSQHLLNVFFEGCSVFQHCDFRFAGYCKNGEILKAMELFDTMGSKDWSHGNSIISGYADNLMFNEAWSFTYRFGEETRYVTLGSALDLRRDRISEAGDRYITLLLVARSCIASATN